MLSGSEQYFIAELLYAQHCLDKRLDVALDFGLEQNVVKMGAEAYMLTSFSPNPLYSAAALLSICMKPHLSFSSRLPLPSMSAAKCQHFCHVFLKIFHVTVLLFTHFVYFIIQQNMLAVTMFFVVDCFFS